MDMSKSWKCCICGGIFKGWGNDPDPVVTDDDAWCCDECNMTKVIPARIQQLHNNRKGTSNES